MKKKNVISIVAAAVVVLAAFLLEGCGYKGQERGLIRVNEYVSEKLNLDEAQKAKFKEIGLRLEQKRQELCTDRAVLHVVVKNQLGNETFDAEVVRAAVNAEQKKVDIAVDFLLEQLAEFHAVLKPEQRNDLVVLVDKQAGQNRRHNFRHGYTHLVCDNSR